MFMKDVIELGNIVKTGNWNSPQRGRIYSAMGICPCLSCMQGGGGYENMWVLVMEVYETNDGGIER